jgi:hypothetical protein
MEEKFISKRSVIGTYIQTKDGDKINLIFPPTTKYTFDNNTVIADISKSNKSVNYKVFSYLDGRIISNFDCMEAEKLENGNYKLRLRKDYEGVQRSLIFNPVTGKAVSKVYDQMSDMDSEGSFLCVLNVNKRSCKFDYILKIDSNGEVVSDVLNTYTEEVIPYDELVYDENKTIDLITEKARKNFVMGYSLIKK